MRKVMLLLLLAVASNAALAEWQLIDESSDGRIATYVDLSSVTKSGETVDMWTLSDSSEPIDLGEGIVFSSWKERIRYDCKNQKWLSLIRSAHSSSMGAGHNTYDVPVNDEWRELAPDSISAIAWKLACDKK